MKILKGIAAAQGLVFGKMIYFEKSFDSGANETDIDEAAEKALEKVRYLHKKTLDTLGAEKAKIFSAYEMLLSDKMLITPIKAAIESGEDAKSAVENVTKMMSDKLLSSKNEYMRQRAEDILYIGSLLCDVISGASDGFDFPDDGEKYIVAAKELTPVDTMMFDNDKIAGFITEKGGATSHVVILAKSLGIPAVVGADGIEEIKEFNGEDAYLDGYGGRLIITPDESLSEEYARKLDDEKRFSAELDKIKSNDAKTADGEKISVCINIGKPSDLKGYEDEKLDGVGLFRSEFLYSSKSVKPSFDEQVKAYREAIEKASPDAVTIRTLDIGGDKRLDYLDMKDEENPFLGNRGIRLCLKNEEIFAEQLKAILVAARGYTAKIMLPMITSISEIKKARAVLDKVKKELDAQDTEYADKILVGIMIETPASAIMADSFAKHSDFFSVGTNDLVQYITASDRGNADVEDLYNPHHPAVINMLSNVIKAGEKHGIEVSMCGDLASNTEFTKLLIGLGLKKFSVPLPVAGRIKHKISHIDGGSARALAKKVLSAEDEVEIKNIISRG